MWCQCEPLKIFLEMGKNWGFEDKSIWVDNRVDIRPKRDYRSYTKILQISFNLIHILAFSEVNSFCIIPIS